VAKVNHVALLGGQLGEKSRRPGGIDRNGGIVIWGAQQSLVFAGLDVVASPTANDVDGQAVGYCKQPCAGIADCGQTVAVAGQPDECLLDDVRCVVRRPGAPQGETVEVF